MTPETAGELLRGSASRLPSNLIRFGAALEAAGHLTDGWPYYLEKPWKWADEYAAWYDAGEPDPRDVPDFATFELALERINATGRYEAVSDGG